MRGLPGEDVPLLFIDKQVMAVDINNAFVVSESQFFLPHTHCEVYSSRSYVANVCV